MGYETAKSDMGALEAKRLLAVECRTFTPRKEEETRTDCKVGTSKLPSGGHVVDGGERKVAEDGG
ncbi:hypothetical protein H6P81_021086 [Aristolochia fimbriata]|uniref:Uncharacterized protein n=1 Tax=Aristolochia fimbriata TaxID=158543 RepID=A0AAV7DZ76_ARIFI|nr:hypothetical protein H6P81_021086 [Aristolochia fimbriata]